MTISINKDKEEDNNKIDDIEHLLERFTTLMTVNNKNNIIFVFLFFFGFSIIWYTFILLHLMMKYHQSDWYIV